MLHRAHSSTSSGVALFECLVMLVKHVYRPTLVGDIDKGSQRVEPMTTTGSELTTNTSTPVLASIFPYLLLF